LIFDGVRRVSFADSHGDQLHRQLLLLDAIHEVLADLRIDAIERRRVYRGFIHAALAYSLPHKLAEALLEVVLVSVAAEVLYEHHRIGDLQYHDRVEPNGYAIRRLRIEQNLARSAWAACSHRSLGTERGISSAGAHWRRVDAAATKRSRLLDQHDLVTRIGRVHAAGG
jgi:hypothetical protein